MKVLLDSCVFSGALVALTDAGHDVEWVGAWDEDPGDEEVLERAHAQGRVLVTLDKDFGELAVLKGKPHRGIVRIVDLGGPGQATACGEVLRRFEPDLAQAAIVTVQAGHVRVRLREER